MTARFVAAAALVASLACARAPARPADTLRGFVAALRRGDDAAAYRLTTTSFRARVSAEDFTRRLGDAAERQRFIAQAERALVSAPARAEVAFSNDQTLIFIADADGWRIDDLPAETWRQDTPAAALRTLHRAVKEGRFDVVLRLAPAHTRQDLSEETVRAFWSGPEAESRLEQVRVLAEMARHRVIEEGETAHLIHGDGEEVRFVREDGAWCVESL